MRQRPGALELLATLVLGIPPQLPAAVAAGGAVAASDECGSLRASQVEQGRRESDEGGDTWAEVSAR